MTSSLAQRKKIPKNPGMLAISSMCGAHYTFFTKITSLWIKCFVERIILDTENRG